MDRIIERPSGREPRSSFGSFKDWFFCAVIAGAGVVIWDQQGKMEAIRLDYQQRIDAINTHLAVLDLKCKNQPVERGSDGNQ